MTHLKKVSLLDKMKKILIVIITQIVFLSICVPQSLTSKLDSLSALYSFTYDKLKVDSLFNEKYLLNFEQLIDPTHPEGQKFNQRVFLSHLDYNKPVVFITEGYAAWHAESPGFVSELADLLNANQVCVEHRYFGKSVPDTINWNHLTVANAAADQHRIVEVLKVIYSGKWLSTGISKGGQTSMYHRYFYPEDVDISIPYVAPLNFSIEEERVYMFLDSVADEDCRQRIFEFQKELLENKSHYIPAFKNLAKKKNLNYHLGFEKAYELTVLEYSFAFWQWGYADCEQIPQDFSDPDSIIKHLDYVAGLKWISNEGIENLQPFFYQAMKELGFYGYDISPFQKWTSYKNNPTFEFTLPEGISVDFDPYLMQEIDCFIRHHANNMIFIYGEYDPWSASAVELTYHTNSIKIVKPVGNHRTRINNLPADQRKLVMDTLQVWLNE